jgi:nucleotide-binding universal stress UspA family protein
MNTTFYLVTGLALLLGLLLGYLISRAQTGREYSRRLQQAEKILQEAREQAEEVLHRFSELVVAMTGNLPHNITREGNRRDELLKVIAEDPRISILILGASTGPDGPGPLVTALAGKHAGNLRVPLTIVPGGLTEEQIDAVS